MYSKGAANSFLIVVILILLGVIGYLVFRNGNTQTLVVTDSVSNEIHTTLPSDAVLLAQAQALYAKEFPDNFYPMEGSSDATVMDLGEKIDITADGVPEFMINTENGGATTDLFALFRIEEGKVVFAKMKGRGGEISPVTLLAGAGGAGRYGNSFELLPDKHAFSVSSYSLYGTTEDFCVSEVYQWNAQTQLFEYNAALSPQAQKKFNPTCDQVKKEMEL